MTTYDGQCHCGEITWKATLPKETHILCHCNTCKVLNGGSYSMVQIIPTADFSIEKGQVKKYTYKADSGSEVYSYFCPTCSAHPYTEQASMIGKTVIVRTALLKGVEKWDGGPGLEIFTKSRFKWQPQIADQEFEGMPG